MNKKIKNLIILPIMLLVALCLTTNVKAAGFNVSRSVTGVTNPVTNTFTYSVTADSSNPATVTPPSDATLAMSGSVSSNTVTTTKTLWADTVWTGLTYPQPGTYKFTVRESASTNATIYPVDNTTYTVTVYVVNALDSNNVPTGTLNATYIGSQKNGTGTKIDGSSNATFTSSAGLTYITVTEGVKGNGANSGEYFKYLLTISGVSGDVYTISGQDSTVKYNGSNVSTSGTYTVGSGNQYIYLKHGQTVTIGKNGSASQIPIGVTYSLAQQTAELGYSTYINGSSTSATSTGNLTTVAAAASNTVAFVNEYTSSTPTRVLIKVFPFLILLALSIIGLFAISRTKKLEDKIQSSL